MKIFISQPMRDKTDDEIQKERQKIVDALRTDYDKDAEILDSFFKDAPHDAQPLWYLGESLKLLSQADVAYFADGWQACRGCSIEHEAAWRYGIRIIHD